MKILTLSFLLTLLTTGWTHGQNCVSMGCLSIPPTITAPLTGAVLDNGCNDRGASDGINWQFTWTPVNKAIGYNLYVKHQPAQFASIDVTTSNTTYTKLDPGTWIAPPNSSGWECKVRAKFSDGSFGEWSTTTIFSVEPVNTDCIPPPAAPFLTAPTNGQKLDNGCVTAPNSTNWKFAWSKVAGAVSYQLSVFLTDFGFSFLTHETTNTNFDFIRETPVPVQNYSCKVRAKFSDGSFGSWSSIINFSVEAVETDCPPAPTITYPRPGEIMDNGCEDTRLNPLFWSFFWTASNNEFGPYQIYVKRIGASTPFIDVSYYGTSYHTGKADYIPDGERTGWEVKMRRLVANSNDFGPWSATVPFTVEPVNTDCPCIVVKSHPQSKAVCIGQSATFEASATINSAALTTVKWQRNGVDVTSPVNYTPGSIVNYTTTPLSLYDNNAYYQAVFSNSCATIATNKAILNVDQPAVGGFALSSNIPSAFICPNESKTITLSRFIGKVVKWQFSYDYNVWTDIPNSNSDKLVIKGINRNQTAIYRAVVQSTYGVCLQFTPMYSFPFVAIFRQNCVVGSSLTENMVAETNTFFAKVYPTVTKDKLTVDIQSPTEGEVEIQVFSLTGSSVFSEKRNVVSGYNQVDLSIANLTNGLYIVRIKDNNKNQTLIKINKI